jgi:peptide/nickel transport system ATP-binding protein
MDVCAEKRPEFVEVENGHFAACHLHTRKTPKVTMRG